MKIIYRSLYSERLTRLSYKMNHWKKGILELTKFVAHGALNIKHITRKLSIIFILDIIFYHCKKLIVSIVKINHLTLLNKHKSIFLREKSAGIQGNKGYV